MIKINKISTKLLIMVSIILLIVFGTSYLLHNYFSSDYYLYKMKTKLNAIYEEVKVMSLDQLMENELTIENDNNVTIVSVQNSGSTTEINENIQFALFKDKVSLNKFWITDEVLQRVNEGNTVNQLFNQGKLKSSLLTKIYEQDGNLILIGSVVIHNTDALTIINKFSFYSIVLGIIISLLLVAYFSKRIITPLEQLQDVAKDISNLDFKQVTIRSGDEIEELSISINEMSRRLKSAHAELEKKNQSLNTLISSISHEVKTPLSLIQAYTIGIQDNLDDGTYTDIILEQVKYTSDMVDYLIKLSKIQKSEVHKETFDLKDLLLKVISQYNITLSNKNLTLKTDFHSTQHSIVKEDPNQMEIVFNNLISNAIKYGEENVIKVTLANDVHNTLKFTISNKTTRLKEDHIPYIWDPFYVIEASRNKEISGTGLGLSIVSEILAKNDLKYEATLEGSYISFSVWFEVST